MFERHVISYVISDKVTSQVNSGTEYPVDRISIVCGHTAIPKQSYKDRSEECRGSWVEYSVTIVGTFVWFNMKINIVL